MQISLDDLRDGMIIKKVILKILMKITYYQKLTQNVYNFNAEVHIVSTEVSTKTEESIGKKAKG